MFKFDFGRKGQSTGDPWIDAGIIGFFDYIHERHELAEEYSIEVDFDSFALSTDDNSKVEKFLCHTFEDMKKARYIVKTGRRSLIYNQAQDKLTLTDKISLVSIISSLFPGGNLRPEYDKVPFPEHLSSQLEEMQKTYKKDKSVDTNTINKEGKIFASEPTIQWQIRPILDPNTKIRRKRRKKSKDNVPEQCTFCGRDNPTSFAHSNNYPFIVATKNWSNFFSHQQLELKICSLCEVSSLFAFNRIFFSAVEGVIFLAIPHAESLAEIQTFWVDARYLIGERTLNDKSNILEDAFKYTHLYETVLAFAYQLYRGFSEAREAAKLREESETKQWHFYLAKKLMNSNVLTFDSYVLFDEMERIFRLFDEITQVQDGKGKLLIDFSIMFANLSIREGKNWNNSYREAIANAILRNRPMVESAEALLWKKDTTIRGFTEFVKLYHMFRRDVE